MTYQQAKAKLKEPLVFGNPEQIEALKLMREVQDAKEALEGGELTITELGEIICKGRNFSDEAIKEARRQLDLAKRRKL